jgi:hypothetical protein
MIMSRKMIDTVKIIAGVVIFIILFSSCSYIEHHYTRKDCVVVETEGQLVTVEDVVGHAWCYEVEGDVPSVGTVVDLHMFTNLTDSYIYDDEIVRVSTH